MSGYCPSVSILIPVTENSFFLESTLISAVFQTYDNLEIIIKDNTSTNEVQSMIEREFLPYYKKIVYTKNDTPMTTLQLLQSLIADSNGEYINFLFEKDWFYPTKIEKMMHYFLSDLSNTIQLVTSFQLQIDESGHLIQKQSLIKPFSTDCTINGIECGNAILQGENWIGGLTAPLFKKDGLNEAFGYIKGQPFFDEYVIATWLSILTNGDVVYIANELSFERASLKENSASLDIDQKNEWNQLLLSATRLGYCSNFNK